MCCAHRSLFLSISCWDWRNVCVLIRNSHKLDKIDTFANYSLYESQHLLGYIIILMMVLHGGDSFTLDQ